jgi:hypothetical protein
MPDVQLDVRCNSGIGYILSDDGGIANPALKGPKRTNRENEVRRDQTDESSRLESSPIGQVYKSKECRTKSNRSVNGGVVLRDYAHNNMRVGWGRVGSQNQN